MKTTPVSLLIHTDHTGYTSGDNVNITLYAYKNGQPAAQEPVRVFIFGPEGRKVYRKSLRTDNFGIAACIFRVQKTTKPGQYYLEGHSEHDSIALGSFLVLLQQQAIPLLQFIKNEIKQKKEHKL